MCKPPPPNRARTAGEIKKIFERAGGSLGAPNCVAFQFTQTGVMVVGRDQVDEERMMEIALEAGADDVSSSADFHEITCRPDVLQDVKQAIEAAGIACAPPIW